MYKVSVVWPCGCERSTDAPNEEAAQALVDITLLCGAESAEVKEVDQ